MINPYKDPAPNGIDSTTKLSRATREFILERMRQIEENQLEAKAEGDIETADSWTATFNQLDALLKTPTHGLLSQSRLAFEELELEREFEPAVHRDLNRAERIEAKRDWDQFIAEGGDPSSITVSTFRRR